MSIVPLQPACYLSGKNLYNLFSLNVMSVQVRCAWSNLVISKQRLRNPCEYRQNFISDETGIPTNVWCTGLAKKKSQLTYVLMCENNYLSGRNHCIPNRCLNRGRCQKFRTGYRCFCRKGYYGKHCQSKAYLL